MRIKLRMRGRWWVACLLIVCFGGYGVVATRGQEAPGAARSSMPAQNAIQLPQVDAGTGALAANGIVTIPTAPQVAAVAAVAANAVVTRRTAPAPQPAPTPPVDYAAMLAQVVRAAQTASSPVSAAPQGGAQPGAPAANAGQSPAAQTVAVAPAWSGEVTFDPNLLRSHVAADLSRFSRSYGVVPGVYQVDMYVNEDWRGRADIYFAPTRAGELMTYPCYDETLLDTLGFRLEELSPQNKVRLLGGRELCVPLQTLYPAAHAAYDSGTRRLDVRAPQLLLRASAGRDYVDPALWDDGVNAATLNYRYNSLYRQTRGQQSSSHYLGLEAGLNWGAWRLRHRASVTQDTTEGLRYNSATLYVERPLRSLKSHVVLGQTMTDGWVFDSLDVLGVRLGSENRMRMDWEQQFAPQVRGIARTNARVVIRQQDRVVYETTVPPGAFVINDLPATGSRGELHVTVTESDGSEQRFTVNHTNISEMLRPGLSDYAVAFGRFRGQGRLRRDPWLMQASLRHGFSSSMTGYAGLLGAEGYGALALGAAFNLDIGALASDINFAHAGNQVGYRLRTSYTKSLPDMGTYLTLSAWRNSRQYLDPLQGFSVRNGTPWDAYMQRRTQYMLNLSQRIPQEWGTVTASISHSDYWQLPMREIQYQFDYNVVLKKSFTLGVSLSRNLNTLANRWGTQAMLTLSMPLGGNSPTHLETRLGRTDSGHQWMTGISSAAGARNQVSYQIFANADKPHSGRFQPTGSANIAWRAPRGSVNANINAGRDSRQLGLGMSGSMVAFGGGLVLGNLGTDTTAVVRAKGAAGARIENRIGVTLDGSGKGMVPVRPYRVNRVRLGVEGLSSDVQLKNTEQRATPTAGAVVVLDYETDVGYSVLIKGQMSNGTRLPFSATVMDANNTTVGYVGQGGQALVRLAETRGVLTVLWGMQPDQRCTIDYAIRATREAGTSFRTLEGAVCQLADGVPQASAHGVSAGTGVAAAEEGS